MLSYDLAAGEEEYTLAVMLPVMLGTPGGPCWAGPALGRQILAELGMDPGEVNKLKMLSPLRSYDAEGCMLAACSNVSKLCTPWGRH